MTKKCYNIKKILPVTLGVLFFLFLSLEVSHGQPSFPIPNVEIGVGEAQSPDEVASSIQILFLITILSIAPAILITMTSFTRIIIVLSFLRNAIATQQTPPNQILVGLALFLTLFIMTPVVNEINEEAVQPFLNEEIGQEVALDNALDPLRDFMYRQTRESELALFMDIGEVNMGIEDISQVPTTVLIPAFIISELKTAFIMGFILFVPFVVIDMVVASTLMSMGMMMLPPVMISLPFKLLLFIMVDGWNLLIGQVVTSFN
ncbi:flagellar type III secretion system pore protein FliP [Isachenkonia alkalipeptolytica]|uniref:Flagellar biosynthetic protein FliP n=2 Tax=Isachenkonia alkalipeptolytica TaxID=2565777 RepID=A0AA43XIR0_9CLOT|nr:flagellar type III secretion system pore protein FliP [Isachenkonia alkalipeptolytica]